MRFRWILLLLLHCSLYSYSQVPVGAWRDHLPYNTVKRVEKVGAKLFCATDLSLFTYSTADNQLEKFTKINGLSDIGISTIGYSSQAGILVIAYKNGNIDLVKDNIITNIPDLKRKIITGGKEANDIYFRDKFAYISYPFGILVIDLEKYEINDTYQIGEPGMNYAVNAVTSDGQYYYAATNKGIFRADVNDPFLVNYTRWTQLTDVPDYDSKFNHIAFFGNALITNKPSATEKGDILYVLRNGSWSLLSGNTFDRITELRVSGTKLLISEFHHLLEYNENLELENDYDQWGPLSALLDENNNLWVGSSDAGLIKKPANIENTSFYYPKGPPRNLAYKLLFSNNRLIVSGGGLNPSWGNIYNRGEIYFFENENWTSIYNGNMFDFTTVVADPLDPSKILLGSCGTGVYQYQNNIVTRNWSENNSSLQSMVEAPDNVRVNGIVFDDDHNMWVTNCNAYSPISVRKADTTWKSFSFGSVIQDITMGDIVHDQYGQFWVQLPRGQGMFVFSPNGTIDDESDDEYLRFRPVDVYGTVVSNIFSLAVDKDGYVWVGTDHGPFMYSNPQNIFSGETNGYQPRIPRAGSDIIDPLLGTETINCITVDGANRKWFGTEKGGAFLFSPDGTKQIYQFNTDNSPILSNTVKTIAINDKTGEVFFGTDQGIISFRAIATEPEETLDNAYAFPNPVRPDYNGNIIITRLVANTWVKITNISGDLVYQTKSEGGQAIWNGKNRKGSKVASGVYLIFLTNDDGTTTKVIKLLVVN